MFNLLKSAIKKDSSTKREPNGGNLDDFFTNGVERNALSSTPPASLTSRKNGEGNRGLRSIRNEFRASEYGLVIRDLDKEKEESAQGQSKSTQNDMAQHQAENSASQDAIEASGRTEEVREGGSSEGPTLESVDNQSQDPANNENQQSTEIAPDQHNNDRAEGTESRDPDRETTQETGVPDLAGLNSRDLDEDVTTGLGHTDLPDENEELAQSNLDQDERESPHDDYLPNYHNDEAQEFGQQALEEQAASGMDDSMEGAIKEDVEIDPTQLDEGLEDGEWNPRDLDAEDAENHDPLSPQNPDDLHSRAGTIGDPADGNDSMYGDQGHDFEDDQSYQDYGSEDEANLEGAMSPNNDEVDGRDGLPDFGDEEGANPEDNYSNYDEPPLGDQDDLGPEDSYLDSDQEQGEGDNLEEPNDDFADDDVGSQMADSLGQHEDALDEGHEPSHVGDGFSENNIEEHREGIDDTPYRDDETLGEGLDPGAVEQMSTTSNHSLMEEDEPLEGDDPPEYDDDVDANDGLDRDEDEDGKLEGDDDPYGEDGLEAADEQSLIAESAAAEEERSDLGEDFGSQVHGDESIVDNPLSIPGREWTEDHLAAFQIHVRSKSNIFDFLIQKGVLNRERVPEVIVQALKLCLKDTSKDDTTALRHKKHATVFMEAGGTPLGPYLAFLALTVQSTMNSSKGETDKEGQKQKDEEKPSDEEESKPVASNDEDDPWDDDFGLEDGLEAPPSYFEAPKAVQTAPKPGHDSDTRSKRPEVATNIMVVMYLQAILESSRARVSEPAKAYLEWTFIPQPLQINSEPASCKDENNGSLHEKREKLTAGDHKKWEDVNPLEYVSIGTQPMYSKQHYIDSHDIKAQEAAHMIAMICERLRISKTTLSEYDRTTFVITSSATSISFAYAVFTLEYIKYYKLEEGQPSTLTPEMEDIVIDPEDSKPELTIFESVPYDLSRWDEALEAGELAVAIVEYLQLNGPLLAATEEVPPLSPEDGLNRATSAASSKSAFDDSGKRFPIKIRPHVPEEPISSQDETESNGDAENVSDKGLPTPLFEDQDEALEEDVDDGQEDIEEGQEGGSDGGDGLEEDEHHEDKGLEEDSGDEEASLENDVERGGLDAEGLDQDGAMEDTLDQEDPEEERYDGEGLDEEGLQREAFDDEGLDEEGLDREDSHGELFDEEELDAEPSGMDSMYDEADANGDGEYSNEEYQEMGSEGRADENFEGETADVDGLGDTLADISEEDSAFGEEGSAYGQGGSAYGEGSVYGDEDSAHRQAEADIYSPAEALESPFPDESGMADGPDDQGSTYYEDQYTPEHSLGIDEYPPEEPAEDEYVSGEDDGENFDEYASDAAQTDMDHEDFAPRADGGNEDDYISGEEYGENFYGDVSDGATQAGLDDEEFALEQKLEYEDDYMTGDEYGEDFNNDISDGVTQAEFDDDDDEQLAPREKLGDDYLSGGEDVEEFHNNISHGAVQAGFDDEELTFEEGQGEAGYPSGEDDYQQEHNGYEYGASGYQSDGDDYPSGVGDYPPEEGGYLSEEEDLLSGDDNRAEIPDDTPEEARIVELDDEELPLEQSGFDGDSFSDHEEDSHFGAAEDTYHEDMNYDHGSEVDPSEEFMPRQDGQRYEGDDFEESLHGEDEGEVSFGGKEPKYEDQYEAQGFDDSYEADETQQEFSGHGRDDYSDVEHADDPTTPIREDVEETQHSPHLKAVPTPYQANEKPLPPMPAEHFEKNGVTKSHGSEEDVKSQDHSAQKPAEEDYSQETLPETVYDPNHSKPIQEPTQNPKEPEFPDQDFRFSFQSPDQNQSQNQDQDQDQDQDQETSERPEDQQHLQEEYLPEEEDEATNFEEGEHDQTHHDQYHQQFEHHHDQEYEQQQQHEPPYPASEETPDREPQYGDPVEGYLFDPETQQYYPLDENGQPYIPEEQYEPGQGQEQEYDEEGQQPYYAEEDAGQMKKNGPDREAYDGRGYGEGYDGAGYDGHGYGYGEEYVYDEEEQEQQQLGHGVYDPRAGMGMTAQAQARPVGNVF